MNLLSLYLICCSPQISLPLETETWIMYGQARADLAKINAHITYSPCRDSIIRAFMIKEAIYAMALNGYSITLTDFFSQCLGDAETSQETMRVKNYIKVFSEACFMMKDKATPISISLIQNIYKTLVAGDNEKDLVVTASYSTKIEDLRCNSCSTCKFQDPMSQLEYFINTAHEKLPPLIKEGIAYTQLENTKLFTQDFGHMSSLLFLLMLHANEHLPFPILYPSYYFNKHLFEYHRWLSQMKINGNFEQWVKFYLNAISNSALDGYNRARDIEKLKQQIIEQITLNKKHNAKSLQSRLKALDIIFSYPILHVNTLEHQLNMAYNTADQIISDFVDMGILAEQTQQQRNKLYKFEPYIAILEKEYSI